MKVNSFIIQAHGPHVMETFEGMKKTKLPFQNGQIENSESLELRQTLENFFFFVATVHTLSIF